MIVWLAVFQGFPSFAVAGMFWLVSRARVDRCKKRCENCRGGHGGGCHGASDRDGGGRGDRVMYVFDRCAHSVFELIPV